MEKPLVTVLMTVYNRENVSNTMKSILNQTYENFEFLIVDNASTDRTCDVINSFNDSRIRLVVNEKNMGQTYSLNRGLTLAKGKYIARIDSDDIAMPDRIQKQVEFLENHPDFGLVGSWVRYIDDEDNLTVLMKMPTTDVGLRTMQDIACGMYHPTAMYRTEILRKHNIFYDPDIHMAEDYDMWRKILAYSNGLNLPEVLLYYRKGSQNDSSKHADLMYQECFDVREKICKSSEDKKSMLDEIALERKSKKKIRECIKINKFLVNYLSDRIDKQSEDYNIIKKHINYKIVSTCIHYNDSAYAKLIEVVYSKLRLMYYFFQSKRNGRKTV